MINFENITKKTYILFEEYLKTLGYDLVFSEFLRDQHGLVLRLFIDKDGGVTIDDCAKVSELVSPILDAENLINAHYSLEVSSPGINKPLRRLDHFINVIGNEIKVVLDTPLDNRRNFKGVLLGVNDGSIELQVDNQIYNLSIAQIKKANLVYKF